MRILARIVAAVIILALLAGFGLLMVAVADYQGHVRRDGPQPGPSCDARAC